LGAAGRGRGKKRGTVCVGTYDRGDCEFWRGRGTFGEAEAD